MDDRADHHPTRRVLDAFGLGKLDDRATEAVGRHLESCPSCRRRVAELSPDSFLGHFRGARVRPDTTTTKGPEPTEPSSPDLEPDSPSSSVGTLPPGLEYEILECLGDGGQGSAYLARDPGLHRLVVLKRYHARDASVEHEGQALVRVRSPYTALCYGLERKGDDLFLVMEYIPGDNLSEVCKKRVLSIDEAVRLVERVAEGLEAVHACGLIHRDVKPSNIVLGEDGSPRLVDFGLAAHLGSPALRAISGSPPYMAPEQARGQWERIDARTDIYGLGALLYHLLTGQPPRDGKTPIEVLDQARDEPIVPPRRKNPRIPRVLERACLKAMSADPRSRYPSTAAMRRDLRRYRLMRRAAPMLGGAVLLIALLAMARVSWPKPAPRSDLRVTVFEIPHFPRIDGRHEPKRPGFLGRRSFEAHLEDDVTVQAKLSRPAYSFLIAFRPDGTDELCYPDEEDVPPLADEEPMYPPRTKSTKRYRLSEGTGLYAFALVVSRRPLPPYREWKRLHGPMPWCKGLPWEPGIVWRDDGEGRGPEPLIADSPAGSRGKDAETRGSETSVVTLANRLRGLPGVDLVVVEAFSVEPASGP